MLYNIFLFKGKNVQDLENLNVYSYPDDIITIEKRDLVEKIIFGHDHGELISYCKNNNGNHSNHNHTEHLSLPDPIPQVINEHNLYTVSLSQKIIIGLIFEKEDNPYDYKDIFMELISEYFNDKSTLSLSNDNEIENLLISLFIDIRRYGDEYVDKYPEEKLQYYGDEIYSKVFLFGIDEVGKSSLVRRLITGKFSDNYFMPTRNFNIEYLEEKDTLFALWDMPGQRAYRKKWLTGLQDSNVIIYLMDVANQRRFKEAKREFWRIINRYGIQDIPILILGNKVDLLNLDQNSKEDQLNRLKNELFNQFQFDKITGREWKFLFTSVKTNYNIDAVIENVLRLI
ncbi:MAG: ADP-ribosylation factor-like protein [Promethearchaeia archaeon]